MRIGTRIEVQAPLPEGQESRPAEPEQKRGEKRCIVEAPYRALYTVQMQLMGGHLTQERRGEEKGRMVRWGDGDGGKLESGQ